MKRLLIFFLTLLITVNAIRVDGQIPNWQWVKAGTSNGTYTNIARGIYTDANENTYISGAFQTPTITFGINTLINSAAADVFIVKYDSLGNELWAKSFGGSISEDATSICTDSKGSVYLAGRFSSPSLTIDTATLINNGSFDIFIAKFDSAGNVLWTKSAGNIGEEYLSGIAIDAQDNVYITGQFKSTNLNFGTNVLTNTTLGLFDIFIAKYDSSGTNLWATSSGGTNDDYITGIGIDNQSNIYVTGTITSSSIAVGPTIYTNTGNSDIFVAKYDYNGTGIWVEGMGGISYESGGRIIADAIGNLYVSGTFQNDTISFAADTIVASATADILLAKYDTFGNEIWARAAGGNNYEFARGIAFDAFGNICIGGSFVSPILVFDSIVLLNNTGSFASYIAKYDTIGNVLWAISPTGSSDCMNISTSINNHIYITGQLSAPVYFGSLTFSQSGIFLAKLTDSTVGISEPTQINKEVSVWPMPFNDKLNFSITNAVISNITLYDARGKIILYEQFVKSTVINTVNFAKGVYFYRMQNKNGLLEQGKIVKN